MTDAVTDARLAAAALTLVGTPFRLHGREPGVGLDCVGVIEAAFARSGRAVRLANGYPLRTRIVPSVRLDLERLGLEPVGDTLLPGDVLMLRPSTCQLHLAMVICGTSVVHAHAGLRRVVHSALPPDWPLLHHWRLAPNPRN
ncbi:hypothetical protein BV97_04836 [Novosphingobium resinovorum]|uniref:NlpC/P60 domain-containing protein n=1 Tax=Novosphingobium resinovorum TaxID=158500 RepID=A0A031JPI9_9SPHN|nr:hypothetical protein [Novosphingobium resinovorum]EZP74640.1 hypothetical protein BV97_04836 [Novosphingobium resinovorum]